MCDYDLPGGRLPLYGKHQDFVTKMGKWLSLTPITNIRGMQIKL